MSEFAIQVKNVTKKYNLYERNRDRIIDAFGLSKKPRYKEHYALKGVSFDVKKGESIGIIGTNGAGKSTILKIITGVLNQTDGDVIIDGRISALLELGAGFCEEYTGIDNIYLNGTMMGYTKEEVDAKMDDILSFADIGDFVYQPVKTYSSGMFVRLAFAVAINIEPEILIVDEALSVGDVFFQAKCFRKFEEFKEKGKTVLFVSHDLTSIAKYCDRAILLNKGEKMAEGSPKDMIDLYKKLLIGDSVNGVAHDVNAGGIEAAVARGEGTWKQYFQVNPNVNEYGSHKAEIIDFAIVDGNGNLTNTIEKGTKFQIKSKVKFYEDIQFPIFTYTFKSIKGTDITGTNTMYENKDIPLAQKGDVYVATFEQTMNLQGGEYLLSMSCTGYRDGQFVAYHRLYDLLSISVISEKNTVGFFDMNSEVTIEKC
ncbi:MAG: ABC transporter ATP-binding protein [Lachnospiraceae bacterium]|nr:ABC transporter ATP-binding protein [Lachnospiraceae bacterium]